MAKVKARKRKTPDVGKAMPEYSLRTYGSGDAWHWALHRGSDGLTLAYSNAAMPFKTEKAAAKAATEVAVFFAGRKVPVMSALE